MQGGTLGGFVDRGPSMDMWSGGSASFGGVYGPAAGQAVAETASTTPAMSAMPSFGSILPIPALIALGALAWFAIRNYS